jgi:hypothetical protein
MVDLFAKGYAIAHRFCSSMAPMSPCSLDAPPQSAQALPSAHPIFEHIMALFPVGPFLRAATAKAAADATPAPEAAAQAISALSALFRQTGPNEPTWTFRDSGAHCPQFPSPAAVEASIHLALLGSAVARVQERLKQQLSLFVTSDSRQPSDSRLASAFELLVASIQTRGVLLAAVDALRDALSSPSFRSMTSFHHTFIPAELNAICPSALSASLAALQTPSSSSYAAAAATESTAISEQASELLQVAQQTAVEAIASAVAHHPFVDTALNLCRRVPAAARLRFAPNGTHGAFMPGSTALGPTCPSDAAQALPRAATEALHSIVLDWVRQSNFGALRQDDLCSSLKPAADAAVLSLYLAHADSAVELLSHATESLRKVPGGPEANEAVAEQLELDRKYLQQSLSHP